MGKMFGTSKPTIWGQGWPWNRNDRTSKDHLMFTNNKTIHLSCIPFIGLLNFRK